MSQVILYERMVSLKRPKSNLPLWLVTKLKQLYLKTTELSWISFPPYFKPQRESTFSQLILHNNSFKMMLLEYPLLELTTVCKIRWILLLYKMGSYLTWRDQLPSSKQKDPPLLLAIL